MSRQGPRSNAPKGGQPEQQEAAAILRRLLDAVERGEVDAPGSQGARLLRRMEGAVAALELRVLAPESVKERRPPHLDKGPRSKGA